ncbi:MAG TPA: response regulator transcription factor [Candidatus Obscuribacterales bacterium]
MAARTYRIAGTRQAHILLVEDSEEMASLISAWLHREGYEVTTCATGEEALDHLKARSFDLVIFDWMLPGKSGLEVCKSYRESGGKCPSLMLTTLTHVDDVEVGLDSGCDDYLRKPFELKELCARIRALLRRPAEFQAYDMKAGDITLETKTHKVFRCGQEVHLLPKEFALLRFFMLHPDQVFSPECLLDNIWPSDSSASPDSIRTYVKRLRKKIDAPGEPSVIANVHGVGYKFQPRK